MSSPSGNLGFFQQPGNTGWTREQRFIITHLALGKEDGDSDWDTGTNARARAAANALIAYAKSSSLPSPPAEIPSISYSGSEIHDYATGSVLSKEVTFTAASSQSITITLPEDVQYVAVQETVPSVTSGRKVTIYGGTKFRLSAPEDAKIKSLIEDFTLTGKYSTYGAKRYLTDKPNQYQNLVMLFPTVNMANYSLQLHVTWMHRTQVELLKVDEAGNPLAGAKLQLTDTNGKVIETWTSTTEAKVFYSNQLQPGKEYILSEADAPDGFVTTTATQRFTMPQPSTEGVQTTVIRLVNARNAIHISKRDITGQNELPGAKLSILDQNGEVVEHNGEKLTWISGTTPKVIVGLPRGNYILREEIAPAGYTKTTDVAFVVGPMYDTDEVQTVRMTDDLTRRVIEKVSAKTGQPVVGATLAVYTADGEMARDIFGNEVKFVTDGAPHEITGLPFGSYQLRELEAPAGYATAEPVNFEVSQETQRQSVVMKDELIRVSISKVDITDNEELPGATLSILDRDGKVVELNGEKLTWVSTGQPHEIEMLPAGDYILREEIAPDGYIKAEDIAFTVEDSGEVQKVVMKDDVTRLSVAKTRPDGSLLEGASLSVRDDKGTIVNDRHGNPLVFDSKTEAIEITHLPFGNYVLHEESAPAGFVKANDVEFTLSEESFHVTVTMVDDPITVHFSKKDITNGEELPGATLSILDKNGNVVELNGEKLTWVSGHEPKVIEMLPAGDYILREEIAPDGFLVASDVPFTVTETSEIQMVEMIDDATKVTIEKISALTEKPLSGAVLTILDENRDIVKDRNGNEIRFESGETAIDVRALPFGSYFLHEEKAPDGYESAQDVAFELNETTPHVQVRMIDEPLKASISKVDIATGEELPGATLSILDKDGKVVELNGEKLTWVSTTELKMIDLLPAGEYILREETAPDGYLVASDLPFTITDTAEIQAVVMEDDFTRVEIEKVDEQGQPLAGAALSLETADGEVIAQFVSTVDPERFERLPVGKYVLKETAAPKGYEIAAPIEFEVRATGDVQVVTMVDKLAAIPDTGKTDDKPDHKTETKKPSGGSTVVKSVKTGAGSHLGFWAAAAAVSLAVLAIVFRRRAR